MTTLDYSSAVDYLFSRVNYERTATMPYHADELKLARMRRLLELLGNPQDRLKVVHVAGTKGKGSTCFMLASILRAANYRTGLYSSPHLEHIEERFRVDLQPCSPETLVDLVRMVKPAVDETDRECESRREKGPTYFEVTTAMALMHFLRSGVDLAVLEVGLGGRLDSTNVCRPLVSVITSISFDHTKQLGSTLPQIAREKAGIIKAGVPVISGVKQREPGGAIAEAADALDSPLRVLGRDFDFSVIPPTDSATIPKPRMCFLCGVDGRPELRWNDLELGLLGQHQTANAAVALATIHELQSLGFEFPPRAIRAGLAQVSCPARVEVVRERPLTILDVAHNVASIDALVDALPPRHERPTRLLLFATTQGKDARGMLRRLLPEFDQVFLTRYQNNPRGLDAARLSDLAREVRDLLQLDTQIVHFGESKSAWSALDDRATADDLVCVTGSFFIAAEIGTLLR